VKNRKILDIGSLWPHFANATADVSRLQMWCSISLDCLLEYLHLWNASLHLASETETNCFLDWKQFYKVRLGFPEVVKNIKEPKWVLKSVHFKKTVSGILFLSKLWYFLFLFVLKVPQFWKKWDLRNCLLKKNGF
jgi:hypothetical protein